MIGLEGGKSALYQWDLNQRLILSDIKENVEVHFSSIYDNESECPVVLTYEEDGEVYADIPNVLLQKSGIISVYVCVEEKDKAYTKYNAEILVLPRKKPTDYVYTEDEIYSFEYLEKRMDEIEQKGVSDERIAESVADYMSKNPVEIDNKTLIRNADGTLMVNVTDKVEEDNTLPITSAGVNVVVGNIGAILDTI